MRLLANILWLILGGFIVALVWAFFGLLWCITIAGIPVGLQCFKAARLTLAPFGKEVILGGGAFSLVFNLLWLIFGGIELALLNLTLGVLLCLTIVGIPFGKQYFKFAKLSLMPMGARVVHLSHH